MRKYAKVWSCKSIFCIFFSLQTLGVCLPTLYSFAKTWPYADDWNISQFSCWSYQLFHLQWLHPLDLYLSNSFLLSPYRHHHSFMWTILKSNLVYFSKMKVEMGNISKMWLVCRRCHFKVFLYCQQLESSPPSSAKATFMWHFNSRLSEWELHKELLYGKGNGYTVNVFHIQTSLL